MEYVDKCGIGNPSGKKSCNAVSNIKSFYLICILCVVVIVCNLYVAMHSSDFPQLLVASVFVVGVMYTIGIPLAIWLHYKEFVRVCWNEEMISIKRYFKLHDRVTDLEWREISTVSVTVNGVERGSIGNAIRAVEEAPSHSPRLQVIIKVVGPKAEIFEITWKMFQRVELVKILNARDGALKFK